MIINLLRKKIHLKKTTPNKNNKINNSTKKNSLPNSFQTIQFSKIPLTLKRPKNKKTKTSEILKNDFTTEYLNK